MKNERQNLPLVVIFGRTNVGKSTLFNCLSEKRRALVSDIPGTTRDANLNQISWCGQDMMLVDTGGIMDIHNLFVKKGKDDDIDTKVQKIAKNYLTRASVVLFVVDTLSGLLPQDKQMAQALQKIMPRREDIILVANKTDSMKWIGEVAAFNKLGLGEPIAISSVTGSGTGDLLDMIVDKLKTKKLPVQPDTEENKQTIKVAIIGKPNVGKSSLINSILGEDRVIVSAQPHTTREPQNIEFDLENFRITLIDTAGISKKGQRGAKSKKERNDLAKQSIRTSLSTLRKADVALLLLDINEDLTIQESKLVEAIVAEKVSLIIVANKWDAVKERNSKLYTDKIYSNLPFATWAPVVFISALTGEKINKLMDAIINTYKERTTVISENALSKFLLKILKLQPPVRNIAGKRPRLTNFVQTKTNPPVFSINIGMKDKVQFAYIKFIENRLRKKFGFKGTPITIGIEKKRKANN